jgi:urease accessory protein UreF
VALGEHFGGTCEGTVEQWGDLGIEGEYSGISICRFSREWRKQTMNMGKRLIRKTTFFVNK